MYWIPSPKMMNIPSQAAQLIILWAITICCLAPKFSSLIVEKQALLQFKSNVHDPLNNLQSWNSSNPPCGFAGISCDPIAGKVTGISLMNMSFGGNISSSLSNLQSLTSLLLAHNNFTGSLPPELRSLTQLQTLNLSDNSLFGEIPNLSLLRRLKVVDLSGNYFSGHVPLWIGNLTSLVTLRLGYNDFKKAKIPESIAKLKSLKRLELRSMNLIGGLPGWFFELKQLEELDLASNNLCGNIPSSISKLNKLTYLLLQFNNFTGELPREIANLTLLRGFDVSANKLHGSLHPEIGDLKNLIYFQLSDNYFTGKLPEGFAYMPFLSQFYIFGNSFSGNFPREFGMFSPLNLFDISDNEFSGEFPKYLCEKWKLQYLLALNNSFFGEFPLLYSNCKSLTRLRVNQNLLSGKILDGSWALPHLELIDLSDNDFTGGITSEISISTDLTEIILSNNKFSGKLPKEIGYLAKLGKLVLNNNSFSGEIPDHIGQLKQLSLLQLDDNSFNGSIPFALGECISLAQINLARNSFSGNIPDSIYKLHLDSLNISRNKVSGLIPQSLTNLELSLIDLSENMLSGVIPVELYRVGGDTAFEGNEGLCLPHNLMQQFGSKIQICKVNQSPNRVGFYGLILCYASLSTIAIVIICFVVVKIFDKVSISKNYPTKWQGAEEDDGIWKYKIFNSKVKISASDMQRLRTENIIGRGSTGSVYKLDLHRQGQGTVAVKLVQMEEHEKGTLKPFFKEIETLSKIRHRNIMKLYAYFKKGRSHYLVLELMEEGNLHQALHKDAASHQALDLNTRYKIAIGVAQGISYLHHDCSPPIIHRDIKPTNILLNNYVPKITDFGIATCPSISTTSSKLMGTHGYMAPELAYTTKATEKSDVYSYGVVLMELITGRNAIEEEFGEGRGIVSWVRNLWYDSNGDQVLDQRLAVTSTRARDSMREVMNIALLCTEALPSARPSMRDVVNMLLD